MVVLSRRQTDIFHAIKEDVNPSVTPEWVKANYPSTPEQPRKKKKSYPVSKRASKKKFHK